MHPDTRDEILNLAKEIDSINKNLCMSLNKYFKDKDKTVRINADILVNIEMQKKLREMSKFIAQKLYNQYPKDVAKNAIEYVKEPTNLQKMCIKSLKSNIVKDES